MAKAFKIRRGNEIAGFFVVVTVALVMTAIFMGPSTTRWFTPARKLVIQLPPEGSLGLRKGADVLILGSVVGSVGDISVTDAGDMQAELSIRGNFIRFVRSDSRAIIRKPLGIGDASVEITRGREEPLSPTHAVLPTVADKAPTQMLEETLDAFRNEGLPAIKELRTAISEYTKLASELRGQEEAVREVLGHVNRLGKSLEGGTGMAAMLLNDPKPPEAVRAALPKIDSAMDELQLSLKDCAAGGGGGDQGDKTDSGDGGIDAACDRRAAGVDSPGAGNVASDRAIDRGAAAERADSRGHDVHEAIDAH